MPSTTIGVDIIAKDRASSTLSKIGGATSTSTSKFSKMASVAKVAFSALAVGVGAVGGVIALGLKDAAEYQKLQAQTGAVLKSTGKAAGVTANDVRNLANKIAGYSDGNDDAIQSGENLLLTFTNIQNGVGKSNQIFDRATKTIADMSFALGQDTSSSAIQLGKALNDPIKGITALQRVGVAFTDAQKKQIEGMVKAGHTMKAQKVILGELHKEFGGSARAAGQTFAGAMGRLKDALGDTLRNAVMPLLPHLTDLANWAAKKIPAAIKAAKGAFNDLKGVLKTVAGEISDALGGIKLKDVGGKLKNQAKQWAGPVIAGFKQGLNTGDWSGLGKALGNGIFKAAGAMGDLAGKLGDAFGKVDWVGLGLTVGKKAVPFFIGFAAGLLNFDVGATFSQIMDHWSDILLGVLALALPGEKVAAKIGELLLKIPFAGKLLSWGFLALNKFSRGLVSKVFDALKFMGRAFLEGFRKVFPTVGKSFAEHLALFPTRVVGAALNVAEKAKAMMKGLGTAIARGVGAVARAIGQVVANILKPFADAGSWLVKRGAEVLGGLLRGITSKMSDALAPIRGLGGKVVSAVGNLGSKLFSAGEAVMQGFIDGIQAKVRPLIDKLKTVTGLITKYKGPIDKDRELLRPAGRAIMDGLMQGIEDRRLPLQAALTKVTSAIEQVGNKIGNAMGKVSNLQGIRSGFAGTFTADSIFGTDLSEGGNLDTLFAAQAAQRDQARQLLHDITKTTGMGLSKSLVKQLQSQGTSGAAALHLLAQGSKADIRRFNQLNNQTSDSLRAAGLRAGNAARGGSIGADIRTAQRQVRAIEKQEHILEQLEHHLKDIAHSQKKDQTIVVEIDGEAVIRSIVRRNKRKGLKTAGV